ncbi:hypothetical protein DFQ30_002498, partial [Apophysomyces sp. BC1015]
MVRFRNASSHLEPPRLPLRRMLRAGARSSPDPCGPHRLSHNPCQPPAARGRRIGIVALKLHQDSTGALNTVTGYGAGYVDVNLQRYEHSILVFPQEPVVPWPVSSFDALAPAHFDALLESADPSGIEVVIFGTGARLRFAHPRLTVALSSRRIGVEAMDFQAACRTYNILVAEGRKVALALLIEKPLARPDAAGGAVDRTVPPRRRHCHAIAQAAAVVGRAAAAHAAAHARVVRAAELAAPDPERRGTLRGNGARDASHRRLDHTALQRLQIFREAAAADLAQRAHVRVAWPGRLAGAALHGTERICRHPADRLHRRTGVQSGRRRDGRDRAGRVAVLEPDGPLQRAGHRPVVLDGTHPVLAAARAARAAVRRRTARLDVAVLGVDGARRAVQGTGRADPARRGPGALYAAGARLGAVQTPPPAQRRAGARRDRAAVVRARATRQSGILPLLLHRSAVRALPDAGAKPPRAVLLFRRRAAGWLPAMAVGRRAEHPPRLAHAAPAERLRAGHAAAGVVSLHLPVLQCVALEADLVHAASRTGARTGDRPVPAERHARAMAAPPARLRGVFGGRGRARVLCADRTRRREHAERTVSRVH